MAIPVVNPIRQKTEGVTNFAGLWHAPKVRSNAFWDMRNLSAGKLPVMSVRKPRTRLRVLERPNGLLAHDKLCWVDGTGLYYGGELVGTVTDGEKQLVRMGAYVLVWPDAVSYNTHTGEFAALGHRRASYTDMPVSWHICRSDGEAYGTYALGADAPTDPASGDLWLDTSGESHVLHFYSEAAGMWQSIATVYTKIESVGIGQGFKQFDGVTIEGLSEEGLNGDFYLVDCGDDYLIVTAIVDSAGQQTGGLAVERKIPEMDFICECNNRIWGCSSEKHEVYACTLGDATNWNQFLGQATDSYAATVGSAGAFTGCCAYMGSVFFWKEDCFHRVMGYKPANYELTATECRGVQKGSAGSLCVVNEQLLFKGREDVCRLGSSTPSKISAALGDESYTDAVGGGYGRMYYLTMRDKEGCPQTFVYDTETGAWVKEDEADIRRYASVDGELYMLTASGELWSVGGKGAEAYADGEPVAEETVEWMLDTGDMGIDEPGNKHIRRMQLYCQCGAETRFRVEVRTDEARVWREIYRTNARKQRGLTIPYVPPRCRTIRLRIQGEGDFQLYQLVRATEEGSDVYA